MYTHIPIEVSEKALELCERIAPGRRPIFLAIKSDAACTPNNCFENVRRRVEKEGGRIQYGWALWEWPKVFVEAEHHAVHEPAAGPSWLDITPCAEGSHRRLFLPDDHAPYTFHNEGLRHDNIRMALSDDPDIDEFFKAAKKRSDFYNRLPGIGEIEISSLEEREFEKLERRVARAVAVLGEKYGKS